MDPVKMTRDDLLIFWTLRQGVKNEKTGETLDDVFQMRGRVYYKDDKLLPKPRLLCEVLIPADTAKFLTMEKLVAFAEERAQLDIDEIAGTGIFAKGGLRHGEELEHDLDVLREAMAR